ncbi:uncharacterized protein LOC105259357 isoform X1 [Camponotus floridanus]|uniref:uncharacterized protein LOC105259357 isoform X1 n=1 Tax=Camponotus floridanus TaxID=104421 RepID=UPI000DC66B39|nr:uncharacterized protein LOC105259357 isoform X1 [Camponotus floridanus]
MYNNANIERHLINDDIFKKINKRFISLDFHDERNHNQHLSRVFEKLTEAMQQQSPLFKKMYERILWAGSYYKKTRVGDPGEYDLDLVMRLPFKERDIIFISDCPSYIKIRTTWGDRDNTLNLGQEALRELSAFIDDESYLNQDKFRGWIEGILSKVADKNNKIVFSGYSPITVRKTGPAFTLTVSFEVSGKPVDIDVVPVLAFSTSKPPPRCSKMSILKNCNPGSRYWSIVPKPLNNSRANFKDRRSRYWRLCFYEFEKDLLSNQSIYGRAKPIIRHLKKLRDTQKWNAIASYYIETLCLNELNIFRISNKQSDTSLFFTMLQQLREAFRKGRISYYWDEDLNLLERITHDEMRNMEGRINRIIKDIETTIANDKYAIARYILNGDELRSLINPCSSYQSESSESSESEPASEWNCVIV